MAYNTNEERLKVKGSEQITRDLKVNRDVFVTGNLEANKVDVTELDAETIKTSGDLDVHGEGIFREDVSISGDLAVNGTMHINDTETSQTSDDYMVLRHNKSTALGANEQSGIVVHNYYPNKTATLTVGGDGTWRAADNTETDTVYTNKSYFNGVFYDGLDQTTTATITAGIKTGFDEDELDEVAYYTTNDKYYHFDGTNWFEVSLVSNALTIASSPESDATILAALALLTRYDLVYFRSLTITTISEVENEPLLTRAEANTLNNNDLLVWNEAAEKAVNSPRPTVNHTYLRALVDSNTGAVTYDWASGGGVGIAFIGTRAQYNTAKLIPEGQDGFIPAGSKVIITDEDAYITGDER